VPGTSRRFVVQRHRATRLHYDFRLEVDGVLASWAVPKGPSLDPGARRIAIRTDDHPLEYYDFEGVIPPGDYGAGDVIVWDAGSFELADHADPKRALAAGELHFDLSGVKLHGRFVLVRTGTGERDQWLLLHKRDRFAAKGYNPEDHPTSVLSGRTNDQVQADPDRLWRSDLPLHSASVALKPSTMELPDDDLAALDRLGAAGTWSVYGRDLRVTNLDKQLFPARRGSDPVTKRRSCCRTWHGGH
jgi:bifunctional non-homologous end joining protein LigD